MNEFTYCQHCNKPIVFKRTAKGMSMPCDSARVNYVLDEQGPFKIFTEAGVFVHGHIVDAWGPKAEKGYISHFHTCSHVLARTRANDREKAMKSYLASQQPPADPAPKPIEKPAAKPAPAVEDLGVQLSLFPSESRRLKESMI